MGPRIAGVFLVLLTLTGCTSEHDPGPTNPSPQQSPTPDAGAPYRQMG